MALQRPASLTDSFLQGLVARVPSTGGGTWKLTEVYTGDVLVELAQSTPAAIEAAHATTDVTRAESGKNRRMAIEETCHPVMVMSHYLKRPPRLLAPTRRGGPV